MTLEGFQIDFLKGIIEDRELKVKAAVDEVKAKGDRASVGEMFDLQFMMSKFTTFVEGATSLVSAMSTACMSIARNAKN